MEERARPVYKVGGKRAVLEALLSDKPVAKIFLLNTIRGEFEIKIRRLCSEKGIPLSKVPKNKLDRMINRGHQGVVASLSPTRFYDLNQIIPHAFEQGETPLILVLDSLTDVRNFGSIVRSAEIFGVHAILVPFKNHAPLNEVVVKTSAGALFHIPVCRTQSVSQSLDYLKESGCVLLGASEKASKTVFEMDLTGPTAIVMGSEGSGFSSGVVKALDDVFRIPQVGKTGSLNVSVAAGIVLFEINRQRMVYA
jgi:23S rRNA (guanosine2251-2'-O)-methyltransferase